MINFLSYPSSNIRKDTHKYLVFSLQIYACTCRTKTISEEGQPNSITNSYYPNTSQEIESSCQGCVNFHAQMQTCHLLGYMMGFSKNSDQRSLNTFTSERHTAFARQDTKNLLMTAKLPALGIWRQTETWFLTSHFIRRDSAPLGTAIWIPKHKTGPPNCTRLNVNNIQYCPETRTNCLSELIFG